MSVARKYLEAVAEMRGPKRLAGWRYDGVERFVLEHGRPWAFAPKPRAVRYGKLQECFRNAANLAMDDDRLVYVEGWAFGLIPAHHAWCVTRDGVVVDNTWRPRVDAPEHFGVQIKKGWLAAALVRQRHYGVLFGTGFPLMTADPSEWKETLVEKGDA